MRNDMPIILIPCVSKKLDRPVKAKDLYISPYFTKCRQYAEAYGFRYHILSAKHGLLWPDEVIEPYDHTLEQLTASMLAHWSARVFRQYVSRAYGHSHPIFIVAGNLYRKKLVPLFRGAGYTVTVPFEGLSIGEQMSAMTYLTDINVRIL